MPDDLKLSPQTYEDDEGGAAGTVSGRVTDPNGATVAGASVIITNMATNQTVNTTSTSSDGMFRSPTLAPGTYRVTINASGYKRHEITNVTVGGNLPAYANARLEVGTISETVTVTAEQFSNFPSQRTVQGLYALAPANSRLYNGGVTLSVQTNLSDAITRPDSGVEASTQRSRRSV
jgi:hypothetical protein